MYVLQDTFNDVLVGVFTSEEKAMLYVRATRIEDQFCITKFIVNPIPPPITSEPNNDGES